MLARPETKDRHLAELIGSVATAVLLIATVAYAGDGRLGKLAIESSLPALAGRIELTLPQTAKDEARPNSVMGTAESADQESRFVIDAGSERMVVMVWDLFASAPADLLAATKAELREEESSRETAPTDLADPKLKAIRARPRKPELENGAALVDAAYIALADGSVVSVSAYANAKAFEDLAGVRALAERVIASVKGGSHPLRREAGRRSLGDLTVTVPADVVLSTQDGPDFTVYMLRKLRLLGSTPVATIGIYVGHNPTLIHAQSEYKETTIAKVKGEILGRDVEWDAWNTPEGTRTLEVIAPIDDSSTPPLLAHIFITAREQDDVDFGRRIAETITALKKT